jgi:hypothetical protein
MTPLRIVLAVPELAAYPQGGGHWSVYLQYAFGLKALGHDVFVLTELESNDPQHERERLITTFLRRMTLYGFGRRSLVITYPKPKEESTIDEVSVYGASKESFRDIVRDADLLWNFASLLRGPCLSMFRRTALIDQDPGHLQVSVVLGADRIDKHDTYFTVGLNINAPECQVPHLGMHWHSVPPPVFLPMWEKTDDPGQDAPFSSITHWTWEELWIDGRVLSVSKREAYVNYVEIPSRVNARFELAVRMSFDNASFERYGWSLIDPDRVASTPGRYRRYIRRSRAEFGCPKPIHKELKSGWFSDRSACYLATGRPVLCEHTGFDALLPTGCGLVGFASLDEAVAGAGAILLDYRGHRRAARAIAEEYLNSHTILDKMLRLC